MKLNGTSWSVFHKLLLFKEIVLDIDEEKESKSKSHVMEEITNVSIT